MAATQTLKEFAYKADPVDKGYANKTLYVNVGSNEIAIKDVDDKMKRTFTGGKGFGLWLLWNAIGPATRWDDPANEICIAGGPLGGNTVFPGSGKSIVTTISPATGSVMDSNVGGYFGPYLKFSGFDAVEIQGKAEREVIVVIDGDAGKVQIQSFDQLPEDSHLLAAALGEIYSPDSLKNVCSVSAGSGADKGVMGCLNFSYYDLKRQCFHLKQAGRGGTGTVLRDKNIRAIVCKFSGMKSGILNPADGDALKEVSRSYAKEIRTLDPKQNQMAQVGTAHLPSIMNEFDTLPVNNFKFGSHPQAHELDQEAYRKRFHKGFDGCWMGCTVACAHTVKDFPLSTGPYAGQKVWVDGPEYETIAGCGSNWGIFDADFVIEVNFYCDTYGLDSISVGTTIAFVMECYEMGLINKEQTGGLELNFGAKDAALELLHQMARGEGLGKHVARGIRYLKKYFAEEFGADPRVMADIGMESKGLEFSEYITKESLAQQGGYGLALKGPQHDEAWLIFLDAVHNLMPTFQQKAENLYWFPMWRTWFGLNGLCKLPWNDIVPEDNKQTPEPAKVMKHVHWYGENFRAVTGQEVTVEDMLKASERVYNFQRLFNLRQGFGTREHDQIPYRAVGPVTAEEYESRAERYDGQLQEKGIMDPAGKSTAEKMAALRRHREEQYQKLTDVVYANRGWTNNGVPTAAKVRELGIDFPEVMELIAPHQ